MSATPHQRFPEPVLLLAAGKGTRMLPLTQTTPKPLIKVDGIPLINRVISAFYAEGARHFALNAHHLMAAVETHTAALPADFPGATFALSLESDQLLNTGGGAKKAMHLVEGDPVFISNTDAFWQASDDLRLGRMRAQFSERGGIVLLCAHPARATGFCRSHDFCLAPDGSVTNDRGVPVIYTGVALLNRSAFDDTPDGPFSFADMLFKAQDAGQLSGILLDADWLHVGDPEAIAEAESRIAK